MHLYAGLPTSAEEESDKKTSEEEASETVNTEQEESHLMCY